MRGKRAALRGAGEVHRVYSVYHVVGMKRRDAPDISRSSSAAKE